MNTIAKVVSLIALSATIAPCLLFYAGRFDLDTVKLTSLIGTVVWFASTPLWMGRELSVDAKEVEI